MDIFEKYGECYIKILAPKKDPPFNDQVQEHITLNDLYKAFEKRMMPKVLEEVRKEMGILKVKADAYDKLRDLFESRGD